MARSNRSPVHPAAPAGTPLPELPLSHPAFLLAALVAAACVVAAVTYLMFDTDVWQHLAVGRAIWSLHRVPTTELWTWPTYGAPDVNASWGFRALIWPLWKAWGLWGLYLWRWLSALAAFGLLVATARRMGARGVTALVVAVACALVYRQRSQVRPETLVAVLLALELWVLEGWRSGGKDRTTWLVGVAWVWANAHISYWVGLAVIGIYVLDAMAAGRRWQKLVWVGLAAGAVSFVNPWGWRALWQPIEYFLYWRKEPIMMTIGELAPVAWSNNLRNTLPVLVVAWPVLAMWRWRRRGADVAELLMLGMFSALAFPSQRFLGYWALVAVPYLARDLGEWVGGLRLAPVLHRPWVRASLAAAGCILIALPELARVEFPLGVGFKWKTYPVKACDFMEAHGVRGRGFNPFAAGGYMLYRFWPHPDRLPFMDIHQAGTRQDRYLYAYAMQDSQAWHMLDRKYRFDYILMFRSDLLRDRFAGYLDDDSTWAPVFLDDRGAVLVRRGGPLDAIAREFAYHAIPVGTAALGPLGKACAIDTVFRARVQAELEREKAGSPWNARAKSLLANIALLEHRDRDAEQLLMDAIASDPLAPTVHLRLGLLDLQHGQPRAALARFERERKLQGDSAPTRLAEGAAWTALGDAAQARASYRRALGLDPGSVAARDSLAALGLRSEP